MLTFDPKNYLVCFIADGKMSNPMPLFDMTEHSHGPGVVILGGRAFAIDVTDLGWVHTSTDEVVPAEINRNEAERAARPHAFEKDHHNSLCRLCARDAGAESHDSESARDPRDVIAPPLEIDPNSDFARAARPHPFTVEEDPTSKTGYGSNCELCGAPAAAAIHMLPTAVPPPADPELPGELEPLDEKVDREG